MYYSVGICTGIIHSAGFDKSCETLTQSAIDQEGQIYVGLVPKHKSTEKQTEKEFQGRKVCNDAAIEL